MAAIRTNQRQVSANYKNRKAMNSQDANEPVGNVFLWAQASGEAQVYQAGRDLYVQLQPTAPATVKDSLPRDIGAFTGREAEIREITHSIARFTGEGKSLPIVALNGMAGVGKTALAIHVGHRLAGKFPDGRLFIDLHAHTAGQRPVDPGEALASLLATTGLEPRQLPLGLDDRAAMWRDRVQNKKILLILDNVASTDQIKLLLPASPECLTLITSRRRLSALGAFPLELDVLNANQATDMFTRIVPRSFQELDQVSQLVEQCGYLPLAVGLLAGVLNNRPSMKVHHLVEDLNDAENRLTVIRAENQELTAAFDLSYLHQPTTQKHLFRCLGLHLGVEFDVYAAAALANLSLDEIGRRLQGLYGDHLIEEPTFGRYRMHDLVRDYARALANDPANDREQTIVRLLDYYEGAVRLAARHVGRDSRTSASSVSDSDQSIILPDFSNRKEALAWARIERANLLSCIEYAMRRDQKGRTIGLVSAMASFLRIDGPWDHAATLHRTAARIARDLHNQEGEANALRNLGLVQWLAGDYRPAIEVLELSQSIYRDLGEQVSEALILNDLGGVKEASGDYVGAADSLEQALAIHRRLDNKPGEANALGRLGTVCWLTGNYLGAANALRKALGLFRSLGDRHGEADVLNDLGVVGYLRGDYCEARQMLKKALRLFRELGTRHGEANALTDLAVVHCHIGNYREAADLLTNALEIYQELGAPYGRANALCNLGMVRYSTGDHLGSSECLDEALVLYDELGHSLGQAEVLNHKGTLDRISGKLTSAMDYYERARQLALSVGSPLEEGRALEGLGKCQLNRDNDSAGMEALRKALSIFRRIGVAEAERLIAESNP